MANIRVLVVDDSALVRQMLTRALSMDPRIEVVGKAKNGLEAIEMARDLDPDVVTLDIEMPELSGLEALPFIQRNSSARVVMLSSLDDPETTYQAMELGAVDFIGKPHAGMASSITELTELLLKTIKIANRIPAAKAATIAKEVLEPLSLPGTKLRSGHASATDVLACVGIAASTGGPPVLERVVGGLVREMPACYLITQHLPPGFSASLARRLDGTGEVDVLEATDGLTLKPGHAYVAPHGRHMSIEQYGGALRITLADGPVLHGVKPAADPMFESIARVFGPRSVGVVLTGMGSDGSQGAAAIRAAGGEVIAQDEPTSVVWGMPGSAVNEGVVDRVVPAGMVAAEVRRALRTRVDETRA